METPMRKFLTTTLFATLLATHITAQEAAAPAADALASAPADQQRAARPQEITRNVHEDWQIKCTVGENQQCYMTQLILGANGGGLMEITLIPANIENEPDAILGATIVAPLNILLQRGVYLQVDENDPNLQEFDWCAQIGCYARFGITQADVDSYSKANKLTAVIFGIQNPQQGMAINISLLGFTAAFKELMETEAELAN